MQLVASDPNSSTLEMHSSNRVTAVHSICVLYPFVYIIKMHINEASTLSLNSNFGPQLVQPSRISTTIVMLTRILLWIALSAFVVLSSEGKDTGSMTLPYDFYNFYACGSNHYRDSSNFLCGTCPTGQEVDESTIGGDGDYEGCHCSASYTSVENDCSSVSTFFSV